MKSVHKRGDVRERYEILPSLGFYTRNHARTTKSCRHWTNQNHRTDINKVSKQRQKSFSNRRKKQTMPGQDQGRRGYAAWMSIEEGGEKGGQKKGVAARFDVEGEGRRFW